MKKNLIYELKQVFPNHNFQTFNRILLIDGEYGGDYFSLEKQINESTNWNELLEDIRKKISDITEKHEVIESRIKLEDLTKESIKSSDYLIREYLENETLIDKYNLSEIHGNDLDDLVRDTLGCISPISLQAISKKDK